MKKCIGSNQKVTNNAAFSFRIFLYVLCIVICIFILLPTFWALLSSFLSQENISSLIISNKITGLTFDNYLSVFSEKNILRWILNSLIVAISQTVFYVLIASLAAFGFTKLEWKGKNALFWVCMTSMLVPGIVNTIPNLTIISSLGLKDNYLAMILPGLSGVFGVFLIRQFMLNIPKDYVEAARIDGASYFKIYFTIILPMCGPALASLAIFTFQGAWNDFLWPYLVTSSNEMRTLTSGLYTMISSEPNQGIRMAASIVSALPVLIVFCFGQKYFTGGMSGGIKG